MKLSLVEFTSTIPDRERFSEIEQVRYALHPGLMGGFLQEIIGASGAHPCNILDMKYEPGEYCTILYSLGEQMLVGDIRWKEKKSAPPEEGRKIPQLGMQVYLFPEDPWLPAIPAVLSTVVITRAFSQALPEIASGEARLLRVTRSIQRYRPGKRLTLRFDVALKTTASGEVKYRTLYGKVFHKLEKARPVFEDMQLLAESAAVREGKISLAGAVAFLPELSLVLQDPVSGTPLEDLIGRMDGKARRGDARGEAGVERAASALAAVHTAGLETRRERPIESELVRFVERSEKIRKVDEVQGIRMLAFAEVLPNWLEKLDEWGAHNTLIHGDCKPSQFLIDGERVSLLDFDHSGMSDPANDVGVFLATLRQLSCWQSHKAGGDDDSSSRAAWLLALEKRFLDAYGLAAGQDEAFRLRATWYQAAGLMRKALRGFGRSPFSPFPGILVEEAWRCLEELPGGIRKSDGKAR
jgi:hypothetical protein